MKSVKSFKSVKSVHESLSVKFSREPVREQDSSSSPPSNQSSAQEPDRCPGTRTQLLLQGWNSTTWDQIGVGEPAPEQDSCYSKQIVVLKVVLGTISQIVSGNQNMTPPKCLFSRVGGQEQCRPMGCVLFSVLWAAMCLPV